MSGSMRRARWQHRLAVVTGVCGILSAAIAISTAYVTCVWCWSEHWCVWVGAFQIGVVLPLDDMIPLRNADDGYSSPHGAIYTHPANNLCNATRLVLPSWQRGVGHLEIGIPLLSACAVFGAAALWLYKISAVCPTAGQCSQCGYDLKGNISGICPECGRPFRSR